MLTGEFIAVNICLKKEEESYINNLIFLFKKSEKRRESYI